MPALPPAPVLQRWLTEVLFEGAPADVKSPYDALLVSDVW